MPNVSMCAMCVLITRFLKSRACLFKSQKGNFFLFNYLLFFFLKKKRNSLRAPPTIRVILAVQKNSFFYFSYSFFNTNSNKTIYFTVYFL
jgi:hypothetical protein